jgi:hypothetical protein
MYLLIRCSTIESTGSALRGLKQLPGNVREAILFRDGRQSVSTMPIPIEERSCVSGDRILIKESQRAEASWRQSVSAGFGFGFLSYREAEFALVFHRGGMPKSSVTV